MKTNTPPFYVGQRVVALINHSWGFFKKDDEFTVTGCFFGCCNWQISIGMSAFYGYTCTTCRKQHINKGVEQPFMASSFAPITSQFQSITFEEVIKIESPLIGIQ